MLWSQGAQNIGLSNTDLNLCLRAPYSKQAFISTWR